MVLGVVFPDAAHNTTHAFQDLVVIDECKVTHLCGTTIRVIHLTVYVVVPSPLDLYASS